MENLKMINPVLFTISHDHHSFVFKFQMYLILIIIIKIFY